MITGAQNVGKSTFINDFIAQWPTYKVADNSYREKLKADKKIKLNQEGDEESQVMIRDILIEQAQKYTKDEDIIFDRGIFDNLVYSLWLNSKGKASDEFIKSQIPIIRETLKLYDIIFFIPLLKNYNIPIVPSADGSRDLDPIFRDEIDVIMKSLEEQYQKGKRIFFPADDCPALIEIFGDRTQRIEMAKLYIAPSGKCYGEEDTLIKI